MVAELSTTQAGHCTLYELEDNLQALVNTIDVVEERSTRALILQEIGEALPQTQAKRDAVVAFLRQCEAQQKFADAEIERIQNRRLFIGRVRAELESYLVQLIDEFAEPDRRGIKRLAGNFSSMRIQKNPDSVMIVDDKALPLAWKDVVLTMPAHVWEALLERLDLGERALFEQKVKKSEFKPDKRGIAGELKKGTEIPGADLLFGELRLVIE